MSKAHSAKERALIACRRRCCLCCLYKGSKIEVHHIEHRSNGGSDEFDNLIPLCFECHADVKEYDVNHPKGNKFSHAELRTRRDEIYAMPAIRDDVPSGHFKKTYARIAGDRHRILRNDILGYSLREFARFHKLKSVSELEQWENGEREIPLTKLKVLEKHFSVDHRYIEGRSDEVFAWSDCRGIEDYRKLLRKGYSPYLLQGPENNWDHCWICFCEEEKPFPRFTLNTTAGSFSSSGGGKRNILNFMIAVRDYCVSKRTWCGFFEDGIVYHIDDDTVSAIWNESLYSRDMRIFRGPCHEKTDKMNEWLKELPPIERAS